MTGLRYKLERAATLTLTEQTRGVRTAVWRHRLVATAPEAFACVPVGIPVTAGYAA